MFYSMTGFGNAKAEKENFKVAVELKTLNSKFTDINIRLPRLL